MALMLISTFVFQLIDSVLKPLSVEAFLCEKATDIRRRISSVVSSLPCGKSMRNLCVRTNWQEQRKQHILGKRFFSRCKNEKQEDAGVQKSVPRNWALHQMHTEEK